MVTKDEAVALPAADAADAATTPGATVVPDASKSEVLKAPDHAGEPQPVKPPEPAVTATDPANRATARDTGRGGRGSNQLKKLLPAGVRLAQGIINADGWTSGKLVFAFRPDHGPLQFKLDGWNPSCSPRYCVNRVTLETDTDADSREVLLGDGFKLEVIVESFSDKCTFTTEAVMPPDALDARERGIIITAVAVGAATPAEGYTLNEKQC